MNGLRELLGSINEWLRFAEAKNGALVATGLGLSFGLVQFFSDSVNDPTSGRDYYLLAVILQLLLGTVIALSSFLPRTQIGRLLPRKEKEDTDNLLYFGHIAKYSAEHFLASYRELFPNNQAPVSDAEAAFAEQIIVNARIANWKYGCSTWAIRLFLSAFITPFGVLGIESLLNRDQG